MRGMLYRVVSKKKGYDRMDREGVKVWWDGMKHILKEKQRRPYAARLTKAYGYGGSVVVHEITGLALNRITRGKKEWTCSITEVIEQL